MLGKIFALLIAAVSGLSMAMQGAINASLGKIIGLLQATFIVHFIATVTVVFLLFCLGWGKNFWDKLGGIPWYLFLGGIIGVLITYGVVVSIPRLGVAAATTAIIVGQVSTAVIIDHLGLFGLDKIAFTWLKVLGMMFLALGAKLMLS